MYAVFRTGGKQFRAEPGKKIRVPSLGVEAGESITFEDILLASDGTQVQGAPPRTGQEDHRLQAEASEELPPQAGAPTGVY